MRWLLVLGLVACRTTGDVPAQVSIWVPFDKSDGLIRFPVFVNGVVARGMFDTGATGSLISSAFAKKNGIGIGFGGHRAVIAQGAFGQEQASTAEEFRVSFEENDGGTPVQDALLLERDLGSDIILGLQFFRRVVLQIDYPNSRFRYMTRSAATLAKDANTRIKIGSDSRLLVEVEVVGRRQWLMVDTGVSGLIYLPRRTAKEGGWLTNAKPAGQAMGVGITGDAELEKMVLGSMKIGPYELVDVPLVVQNRSDARKVYYEDPTPGVLGYDVLRHFVVTLDLELGLLHLYDPEGVAAGEPADPASAR